MDTFFFFFEKNKNWTYTSLIIKVSIYVDLLARLIAVYDVTYANFKKFINWVKINLKIN